jgi:hypothetical protein
MKTDAVYRASVQIVLHGLYLPGGTSVIFHRDPDLKPSGPGDVRMSPFSL